MKIAVLIPCYNEELTIGKVLADFRRELPTAKLYVYNNNSTDKTEEIALQTGAILRQSYPQGKGYVVRQMFEEINADVYVLVDGDDTYPAEAVHSLINAVADGRADMAVGDRLSTTYFHQNKRAFHSFGNRIVRQLINKLFRAKLKDILSGYRVFNRRFVKNLPLRGGGFEIETQFTLHALDKGFSVAEIPVEYRDRPANSHSKIHTVRDGCRIIMEIISIFRDYKPMAFFGSFSALFLLFALVVGFFPVSEYFQTGLVGHFPLAILATGLSLMSGLSFVCAMILSSLSRFNHERYALRLLDFEREQHTNDE